MKTLFGILLIGAGGLLALPSGALVLLCVFSFRPGCGFSLMLLPVLALGGAIVWGGWALAGFDDAKADPAGADASENVS